MTSRRDRLFWLLPAATFLVGLVLGGVLVGVGNVGAPADPPQAVATPTPTPTTTEPGDESVTVTVPGDCVQAAEQAEEIISLARQAAEAAGALDFRGMQRILGEIRDLEPVVTGAADRCRDAAADGMIS